uniref:Sperm flagellar 2 n=1 Tax=Oryzias melastigma TaxID=30732 RepID=A0A3B3CI04_ORYME
MSEMLLCRWLNQELQLSKVVGMDTLATDFSNGYLIGEILHKYKLQDNFNKFLEKNTSISKVNNFMRLEPTLKLLGISFNMNTAQDLMQEKQGVAAHLLFQLYDALKKRKSPEMKRSLMEVEQPRAEANLYRRERNKLSESGAGLSLQSNTKYMQEIRQRLKEKALADERRQKRQDRFLVEQFKAHAAQQELQRDEQLVKRLTRQTKQEQRLVAQLLQMRMQKEVIRENRLFVEQQYQERREKDFREALYREAVLAQQEKVAREEEIRKDVELCTRISAEQSQNKRKKYFNHCKELLNQIVDLATKVGDYRQLTENTIPEQTMRDWKELFLKGLPLYEPSHEQSLELSALKDSIDLTKLPQEALNNLDYHEYKMIGDWAWPEEAGEIKPPSAKSILENVVRRLKNIVCSSTAKPPNSEYSHFIIKACVLGNICSGKTTCLDRIAEALGIYVLSSDTLVEESLKAYHDGEEVCGVLFLFFFALNQPSPRALLGAAVDKELKKGNAIPNELLVEIMTQAIRQVPAHSGWILDGFPPDISLAHLLEKALGGCEEETKEAAIDQTDIIADCSPPTPPPPPAPVLDVVLMLNIPDECAVRRAYRQAGMFGFFFESRFSGTFLGAWPALEKWYSGKQNILVTVDADVDEDEVYNRVKLILQKILEKKPRGNSGQSRSGTPTSLSQRNSPVQKLLRSASSCSLDYEDEPLSPVRYTLYYAVFVFLICFLSFQLAVHVILHLLATTMDLEHIFCIFFCMHEVSPLPVLLQEIPPLLWSLWDSVCNSYVNNIKKVMQQLRLQRTVVLHELSSIRDGYRHCLGRPNLKQEFVCRWQKDFNSIPDYLREDEEIKAELHQRLDSLWDTTDKCKEQDEQKKAALLSDEWLEEHTAALINSHSILMQVRFSTLSLFWLQMYLKIYVFKKTITLDYNSTYWPQTLCSPFLQEGSDFYLKENPQMVTNLSPPPDPDLSEKPSGFVLSVGALESIHRHVKRSFLLKDMLSINMGKHNLPKTSLSLQLGEIVSVLTDSNDRIDWRRFLLCASLPWPVPSLAQLLYALQSFKLADVYETGFINEEQYLQMELWLTYESAQIVSEDLSESLPRSRVANLTKFFFQLFADSSVSPPQLDYVSMLQYFSADPDPRQGFVRALSVVLGQPLRQPSEDHLIMPLTQVYMELGYEPEECIPFSVLSKHPYIQMLMETSTQYLLVVSFSRNVYIFIFSLL